MQDWILAMVNQFGYIGIALLIAIENVFPPIPSEVILTFGGFLTTYTSMQKWLVILFATIGSVAGAIILYGVGRFLTQERLAYLLNGPIGRILHLKTEDIAHAENWFNRRGKLTVFFCRFIPLVRSLISIPAGMSGMNFGYFLLLTTLGTSIWNVVLVYLGAWAGSSWEMISSYMDVYSKVAVVILGIAFLIAAAIFYKKRMAGRKK